MRLCTARYEVFMKKFFYWLGLSIGRNPRKYIASLLVVTAISCIGFLRFHQINNARETYTDHDSPSHKEGAMFSNFLRQNGTLHMIEVLIKAKDGGNLLRGVCRQQLNDLTKEIVTNITVTNEQGELLTYGEMCEPFCEKNDAFYTLLALFDSSQNGSTASFELTYPVSDILGQKIFLGNNLYGVTTESSTKRIISFDTVILRYYLTNEKLKPMYDFENKLVQILYESEKYPLLNGMAGSDNIVAKEVKRLGTKAAPYLGASLGILCIFLAVCTLRYRRRESKPLEACLGALIPVLSGLTTIGMVSATGLAFQSIIVSTLFLVLAIGIDDIFIILAAWHRTDRKLDIPHRMALTVQEAGCSMTVTTITNLISFGNGVLSTTPVLQTFAIYSSVASVVCYIYQLIIFPAIIAITAPKEYVEMEKDEKSCFPEQFELVEKLTQWSRRVWITLAKIVGTNWMRAVMILVLIGYWYLSGYGVYTMKADLSIQKMSQKEARIVQFKNEADETMRQMQSLAVLVHKPGDLRNPINLEMIKQLVRDFETASYSFGNESTICWVQPYLDFLSFYTDDDLEEDERKSVNFTYTELPTFLKSIPYFKPMIRYNTTACIENSPMCVESFMFTTAWTEKVRYNDVYPLLVEWRQISAKYPSLEVYPYTERSNFADQTNDMVVNIWQTVLSEVVCMALSFILFIPDFISIIAAVFSLLSVNIGVFGFLSLWGIGIDPVSTAALLMSIGFSVDISAHISYHYYQSDHQTPRKKLEHVYNDIGWPTMQGGLSTMLAMMPIIFSQSYLGMVFLKSVILVSTFGLIHGLIVLPVFLSMFSDIVSKFRKNNRTHSSSESSQEIDISPSSSIHYLPHRITIKSLNADLEFGKS